MSLRYQYIINTHHTDLTTIFGTEKYQDSPKFNALPEEEQKTIRELLDHSYKLIVDDELRVMYDQASRRFIILNEECHIIRCGTLEFSIDCETNACFPSNKEKSLNAQYIYSLDKTLLMYVGEGKIRLEHNYNPRQDIRKCRLSMFAHRLFIQGWNDFMSKNYKFLKLPLTLSTLKAPILLSQFKDYKIHNVIDLMVYNLMT